MLYGLADQCFLLPVNFSECVTLKPNMKKKALVSPATTLFSMPDFKKHRLVQMTRAYSCGCRCFPFFSSQKRIVFTTWFSLT
mmetsp:Transcript_269/g.431  ORF Transcript_269/g.431 Transcript_269/m.431 type:complete len:82 (+) Transcript_269:1420-1665(+)